MYPSVVLQCALWRRRRCKPKLDSNLATRLQPCHSLVAVLAGVTGLDAIILLYAALWPVEEAGLARDQGESQVDPLGVKAAKELARETCTGTGTHKQNKSAWHTRHAGAERLLVPATMLEPRPEGWLPGAVEPSCTPDAAAGGRKQHSLLGCQGPLSKRPPLLHSTLPRLPPMLCSYGLERSLAVDDAAQKGCTCNHQLPLPRAGWEGGTLSPALLATHSCSCRPELPWR